MPSKVAAQLPWRDVGLVFLADDGALLHDQERFRDGEQSDQRRDDRHAIVKLEKAESGARRLIDGIGADEADHQPEEAGDQALPGVAAGDGGDQRDAEQHHDDEFDAVHVKADLGEDRHGKQRDDGCQQAAETGGDEGDGERLLAHALLGHRIAVERRRGRAGGARDIDQDGGNAGAHVRRAVNRDHEDQPDLDRHRQGQGQEDDDGVGGAETGQGADDHPQEHRGDDHPPEGQTVQKQMAEGRDLSHGRRPSASGIRTGRVESACRRRR